MTKALRKPLSLMLALVMVVTIMGTTAWAAPVTDVYRTPAQIAVTMTEDPQHSVNITWTTIDTTLTGAIVVVTNTKTGVSKEFDAVKTNRSVSNSNILNEANNAVVNEKSFYNVTVTGLDSGTTYTYVCKAKSSSNDIYESMGNTFKTAADNDEAFTFIYLSDPQASGAHGKAITANTSEFAKYDPDFVYIAGDLTNTAANEGQWETFFNQSGENYENSAYYNDKQTNQMSNYVVAAVRGNHDNNTLAGHLSYPSSAGDNSPLTYAYTYGSARFIMLNMEVGYDLTSESYQEQKAFLEAQVADAKAKGLWTVVGLHKTLYTGASHITDSGVVTLRKSWSSVLAELDVDVVLQGHDHVLSRGFVDETGYGVKATSKIEDRTYAAQKPENAPLYYVGNCASTLKFYKEKDYTVGSGDPLAPNYSDFLDLSSAATIGSVLNPDGPKTGDDFRGPTYTVVSVDKEKISFNTYMFEFDTTSNEVSNSFLYDSFTVYRNGTPEAAIDGDFEVALEEVGDSLDYTISLKDIPENTRVFEMTLKYDPSVFKLESIDSLLENGIVFKADDDGKGNVFIRIGSTSEVKGNADIVKAAFSLVDDSVETNTNISITKGTYVTSDGNDGETGIINHNNANKDISIFSWNKRCDLNGDGVVDSRDLAIALANFGKEANSFKGDVNKDGTIDTADLIIIASLLK